MYMKKILSVLICLLIICGCSKSNNTPLSNKTQITSSDQINGKTIGICTGSVYEKTIRERFPDSNYVYFNTRDELVLALTSNKIDAFITDGHTANQYEKSNKDIICLNEGFIDVENGFIFSDQANSVLDEFNQFLFECKSNGFLDYLKEKWVTNFTNDVRIPEMSFTGENGVLTAITAIDSIPMSFIGDGTLQGYEAELFYNFCSYAGYVPEVYNANFEAVITAVSTNKYDVGFSSITITDERKQSVDFSDPVYQSDSKIVVYNFGDSAVVESNDETKEPIISKEEKVEETPATSNQNDSSILNNLTNDNSKQTNEEKKGFSFKLPSFSFAFLGNIPDKLNKMFIEEDRWKLVLDGIKVTVLITVSSLIIGTILGFLIYLFCRKTGKFFKKIFDTLSFIVNRIPVVLILMFMFYIVFSNSSIDGVYVSIIAFSIIETLSVYSMVDTGISAIDKGQTEAALALGYTDTKALFKFILPQALKTIMPVYCGDIVSLIKATSIVGYITVQDLTRASDIIRSRTFDAFLPLLISAIVYFALAWILTLIVEKIQKKFLPNVKSKEEIINKYK